MQILSQRLLLDRFVVEMRFALRQLGERTGPEYRVRFGYGCRASPGSGRPPFATRKHEVEPAALEAFVEASVGDGTFEPGESDLHVESSDGKVRIVLCHEADIHVAAREPELLGPFRSRWAALGYTWREAPSSAEEGWA